MKPKHRAFVNAYLTGDSQGNATKAAIAAGYSAHTAPQIGSRLLKHPDISQAVGRKLANADIRTDAILARLGKLVHSEPEKVTGSDINTAARTILQVNGALRDKAQTSGITVNIGFLSPHSHDPQAISVTTSVDHSTTTTSALVMPSQPQVLDGATCADGPADG